jgi:F-type H+-transporting ATPase subunit beta
MNTGTITEIIGPIVDVHFPENLPLIQDAIVVEGNDMHPRIVLEVASHLGLDRVRTIAMYDTAGLSRGESVATTGGPISVPVGEASLGRLFNVLGEPIDNKGDIPASAPLRQKFLKQASRRSTSSFLLLKEERLDSSGVQVSGKP